MMRASPQHMLEIRTTGADRLVVAIDERSTIDGRPVGTIAIAERESHPDAIRAALAEAEAWLAARGAVVARCPMGRTVWHGHRAVIDGFPDDGGLPPFPLEPVNGPELPRLLSACGYEVAHRSVSYLVGIADWIAAAGFAERPLHERGFRLRELDPRDFTEDLEAIFPVALDAFRNSWGYSPIALDEFVATHRPLAPLVATGLSQVLEDRRGDTAGFLFAYPDPNAPAGQTGARFVAKTIAVKPSLLRVEPWLGYGLAVAVHRRAAELGFEFAIHPLEAEGRSSQRMSARRGRLIRRYATYQKSLTR